MSLQIARMLRDERFAHFKAGVYIRCTGWAFTKKAQREALPAPWVGAARALERAASAPPS